MSALTDVRVLLSAVCLLSTACGKPLSENECEQLLDRYTERLLLGENPGVADLEVARAQERARSLAKRDPVYEFKECANRVTRRQFQCAMLAPNVDEMEKCLVL